MFFYFLITIISALMMYYILRKKKRIWNDEDGIYQVKKNSKFLYMLPFIPLLLISALRYGIGTDYFWTYYPTFFRIRHGYNLGRSLEPGFLLLNKFVASFSDDVTWVIAICAILFFTFVGKAILEQSENPTLSILLLVGTGLFQFSMNGMRQAIAIAIWMYAIKYIKKQRFGMYVVCMLFASLFHTSGLLLIPFYFLYRLKFDQKRTIILIAGTFIFGNALKKIILFLASFTKYYDKFIGTSQVEGNFAYSTFFVLFAIYIYLLVLNKSLKYIWEYNFFWISTTLGIVCSILTKDIYVIARVLCFFQYMPVLFFPLTVKKFNGRNRFIIEFLAIFFYFIYIWFMADYLGKGDSVPYRSIFSR